jgi:hypothetical protein
MTPFSVEASQAFLDVELSVMAWLFRSLPFGALALLTGVVVAVSWLSWTEARLHPGHGRHAGV